jgi:hypothetical protein
LAFLIRDKARLSVQFKKRPPEIKPGEFLIKNYTHYIFEDPVFYVIAYNFFAG